MSVLISEDRKELIVTCHCGCGNAFHIQLDKSLIDEDEPEDQKVYGYMSYMRNDFVTEQGGRWRNKIKSIVRILRNKDYYYSDVLMTKGDWENFKKWVDAQEV